MLAAPGAAHAATVQLNPIWLSFTAAPGELNDLTVSQTGSEITFNDPGQTLDTSGAGAACGAPVNGQVTCTIGAQEVKVDLGNLDDRYASTASRGTKVDGGDGVDTITGGPAVEKVDGGLGDDVLDGGSAADKLDGGLGVDTLSGGPGNDSLSGGDDGDGLAGGDGDDRLLGGAAADSYAGGAGHDAVDWSDQTAPVTADFNSVADDGVAGAPELLPGDVEQVEGGLAGDDLSAGPVGTVLHGNAGADTLRGGPGNDALHGGADGDELSGGGGTDRFDGEAGTDRVLARDGTNEVIACGTEADFAQVDPLEPVELDCETVDREIPLPPPELAKSVTVAPARGVVTVRRPGGRTVVLQAGDSIPVGSIVDTRRGAVSLTSAANAAGAAQTARFSHGVFQVRQTKAARPITELVLRGRLRCGRSAAGSGKVVASRSGSRRRLWGSGHGRFRTRGRRSSATVRGTVWLTEDRCNGTLTKVRRGVVAVKDFRTGKTKLVRAGKRYFAKRARTRR